MYQNSLNNDSFDIYCNIINIAKADILDPYSDWTNFDLFSINNHPGSAGYQAKITIPWKSGMNADFSDIRFIDGDNQIIPYWIESKTDGVSANVWIKLATSSSLRLYYGNAEAVSESNVDNVMEFGDEFNRADSTDLGLKWWESYYTAQILSNQLKMQSTAYKGVQSTLSFSGERIINFTVFNSGGTADKRFRIFLGSSLQTFDGFNLTMSNNYNISFDRYWNGSVWVIPNVSDGGAGQKPLPSGSEIKIAVTSSNVKLWINSVYVGYWSNVVGDGYLGVYNDTAAHEWAIDNVFVRRYLAIEPSFSLIDTINPSVFAGSDQNKNSLFIQTAIATDASSGINESSYRWSKVSGPGAITFGSSDALSTAVFADQDGTYVIGFVAEDNAGNSTTDTFTLVWDTSVPQITGVSEGGLYNTDKVVIFNEGTATLNGLDFNSGTTVSAEGNYTLIVADNATNSTTVHFVIDKTGPAAFALSFPASNSRVSTKIPSFSWDASSDVIAGLDKYQLYIDEVMNTDNLIYNFYTVLSELTCGNHTWQVKALDTLGNITNSDTYTFSINCGGGIVQRKSNLGNLIISLSDGTFVFSNLPEGITQMAVSSTLDFKDISWEDLKNKEEILKRYIDKDNLYFKFRTESGETSEVINWKRDTNGDSKDYTVLNEGDIVKTSSSFDVYIIKYNNNKQYKRLILSPHVFNSYQHLKWENIKTVSEEQLNQYQTSDLVKVQNDNNIYQLTPNGDQGTKRIIATYNDGILNQIDNNTTIDIDSIYEINEVDRESYEME